MPWPPSAPKSPAPARHSPMRCAPAPPPLPPCWSRKSPAAPPDRRKPIASAQSLAILAALTGGIVLARACRADPLRSRAALDGAAQLARQAAGLPQETP